MNIALLRQWVNPEYLEESKIHDLRSQFDKADPYKHLELPDFFDEEKLAEVLVGLSEEEFEFKESDLFKFSQTHDLATTDISQLQEFRDFLYSSDFIMYMQALTGFTFTDQVDLAGTLYEDTNFLLCHDDQLDDRKVAFLCYLSSMLANQGGSLNLFSTKDKMPKDIVKKVTPRFNTLAFFEVSEVSFHEVEEIYEDTQRIAIGGWYYA